MKPNLLPFIGEKWAGVAQPTARFDGKIIVITGANSGVGFEAAVKFVALGAARVILGVRSMSKGAAAARQIEERTGRKGITSTWELDMGVYSSIQIFAGRVHAELQQLDVAILNAGVTHKDYDVGHEGWQSTLQVNVLGTALLALLLLPKLKESKRPSDISRLVIVTSEAHRWLERKDIPDPASYGGSILRALNSPPSDGEIWDGLSQNAKSKLLAMYVARSVAALATQPTGEIDVIVTSVCPGACRSELARHFKGSGLVTAVGLSIYDALFSKTAEMGARSYVSVAALGPESHGGWYRTTSLATPGDLVTGIGGADMQDKVWHEIVEEIRAKVPGGTICALE